MKINNKPFMAENKLYWLYFTGFFIILALPLLTYPPLFFPPDWGKVIVFRSLLSVLIFVLACQFLYKKNEKITERKIKWKSFSYLSLWLLTLLLAIYFIATIFSAEPYFSFWGSPARSEGSLNFAFFAFLPILLFFLIKGKDWQKIWDFSIFIGFLVTLVGIFQYFGIFNNILIPSEGGGIASTAGYSGFFATYLLLLSFLALSFGLKEVSKKRFFYFICLLFFLFGIFISGARAAYLGIIIGFIYYLLFYPKKIKTLKIIAIIILIIIISIVSYINFSAKLPNVFYENRILSYFSSRLSLKTAWIDITETRASTWKIGIGAIKEKPLLGWGPENFQIAFDKFYDPSLPQMLILWWDRAHNFLIEYAVNAGVPFLIIYLLLISVIFFELQKIKRKNSEQANADNNGLTGKAIIAHAIQAGFVGYLITSLFTFDGFVTHLIFFLLIGYSFFLIYKPEQIEETAKQQKRTQEKSWWKSASVFILACLLIWFIWSFNIKPLKINSQIVIAENFVSQQKCDAALAKTESVFSQKSILDAYSRMKYVNFIKKCATNIGEKDLEYAQKGVETAKIITSKQPTYTRGWIASGAFTNILIEKEKDPKIKQGLFDKAGYYFKKAQKLSPNRPEIYIEWAKAYLVADDLKGMEEKIQQCIALTKDNPDCYWYLGIAQMRLGDTINGQKNLELAKQKGLSYGPTYFYQLIPIYNAAKNYKGLANVYSELTGFSPNNFQYHASFAFVLAKMGEYERAKQEAQIVLKLKGDDPEIRAEVEMFLKTLPY